MFARHEALGEGLHTELNIFPDLDIRITRKPLGLNGNISLVIKPALLSPLRFVQRVSRFNCLLEV